MNKPRLFLLALSFALILVVVISASAGPAPYFVWGNKVFNLTRIEVLDCKTAHAKDADITHDAAWNNCPSFMKQLKKCLASGDNRMSASGSWRDNCIRHGGGGK